MIYRFARSMLWRVVLSRSWSIAPLILSAASRSHFENFSRFITCRIIINGSVPIPVSPKSTPISRSYCWMSWTRQFAVLNM